MKVPAAGVGYDDVDTASSVAVFTEEDLKKAILAEIVSDYKTLLTEEQKSRLPEQIFVAAKRYGYDPFFVAGLIETESSFNNQAVSRVGARGLLQLMPSTAAALAEDLGYPWYGPETLHDPEANLELGLYYLRMLEERFGNLDLALAAYNMGPSQLEQKMAGGFRPRGFYSRKVNAAYREFLERADVMSTRVVADVQM